MKKGKWQKIQLLNQSKDEIYTMQHTFNQMIDYMKSGYEKQEMFVSDASHELKTPIQIIKSNAQLLKRRMKVESDVFSESLNVIDTETDRMKHLVDQMLMLAKNQEIYLHDSVDLIEIVNETVTNFRSTNERTIELHTSSESLLVNGNRHQLEQVIYILVDNALKYSQDKIAVTILRDGSYAMVKVTDYGQGICAEDQERIFDRFYRVDKARSRNTGGSGLGLAIAQSIVQMHQGKLTVASELNKGTTFTFTIKMRD